MTLGAWIAASKQVLEEDGIHPKDHDIVDLFGNWKAFELLGHHNPSQAIQNFLAKLRHLLPKVKLYPNVEETLRALTGVGVKIVIISTSKRESIELTPAYRSIAQYVSFIISAEDVDHHKPDPEGIKIVMKRLRAQPEELLMVGDSDKDVGAALAAGIDSVLFTPATNSQFYDVSKFIALGPTYKIHDHRKVVDIILPRVPALKLAKL